MDTRTFGGFDDLFIGSSGLSVGNIILDGSIKKIDILLYHTDLASKALKSQPADILSVYSNGTAGHIIKSGQERADRGFSASGRSHNCDEFSLSDFKVDVLQHFVYVASGAVTLVQMIHF